MLIVCPACASAYEIDAERVGMEGRSVRCAACRETWFVSPATAAVAAAPVSPDLDLPDGGDFTVVAADDRARDGETAEAGPVIDQAMPYPRRTVRPAPVKRRMPMPSPALVLGLLVFVAVPLALLGRGAVVRMMPQSAGLFSAVGLPVNLRGLDLRDVVAFQNPSEDGKPGQLVVEGDVIGVARERVDVPAIAVEVRDARDQVVYRWTVAAPRPALETAEKARFHASLSAPPAQGRSIGVRFADAGDVESPAAAHGEATRHAGDKADHKAEDEATPDHGH